MTEQEPSVGRIVHVMTHPHEDAGFGPVIRPAIITDVYVDEGDGPKGAISVQVFYKHGILAWDRVPYSIQLKPGHWSWPSRT